MMNRLQPKLKFLKFSFLLLFWIFLGIGVTELHAQNSFTILNEGFNGSVTQVVLSNANFYSGNSGAGDRPQNTAYANSGSGAFGVDNGETIETEFSTVGLCSPRLTFRLGAWSNTVNNNGPDAGDNVLVEVSPDGGTTFYPTLEVIGNNNSCWAYSATGIASTAYDGDNTEVTFQPTGGGLRTTDGYSTMTITNLPISRRVMVRITLATSSASELWTVDDLVVSGTTVPILTTTGGTVCGTGSTALVANTNLCGLTPSMSWFAAASGGASLQTSSVTSSTYNTPSISTATTYYASENFVVGMDITTANSNSTAINRGLTFDVFNTFTLNSVDIRFRKSSNTVGVITGVIQNSAGTTLHTFTANAVGTTNTVANVTANVNYTLSPGTNYRIVLTASTNVNRLYTTNGVGAASHFGYGAITGGYANANYNYFYNWNITGTRIAALASIGSNVTPSVSIASSDLDNSICSGTSVTFTATPTNGGSAPAYQWKLNGANVGSNVSAFTTASLSNNDVVTVVMTANNACQTSATANGNSITTAVTNTLTPAVSIISNDADNFICSGSSVTYTATGVNGGTSPSFQWKINGSNVGTNTNTYSSSVLSNNDVVTVEMTANNTCQTLSLATSNSITTGVGANTSPSVVITSSDVDNAVCQGGAVTYTATPTNGGSAPSYQWVLNGNNVGTSSSTFTNAVNANQSVYVMMTGNYECQTASVVTSNTLEVTAVASVNPNVSIASSDLDDAICSGESVTFTATPTNGGPSPSYQWKLNGANVGTNSAAYTTATLPNNGIVTVVMTANNECQTSTTANGNNINTSVTNAVTPSVAIASPFANNSGNATWAMTTANATNVANVSTSALTQNNNNGATTMLVNNSNSTGYTGASGGNNAAAAVQNGAFNVSTSTYFQFLVTPSPSYSFTISNISFGTRSTPTGPLSYALRSSLDNYSSDIFTGSITNNSTWTLKSHAPATGNVSGIGQAVTYRLYAFGGSGGTINNANWRVDDLVVSFINSQSICSGTNATFTANPTNGGTPSYQWSVNGVAVTETSSTWTSNTLSNGDLVKVTMNSNNACQTASSSEASIIALINASVTPDIQIVSSAVSGSTCVGSTVTFTGTINNGGNAPTYQWKLNGANVGTNTSSYVTSILNDNDVVTCDLMSNAVCPTAATVSSNAITIDIQTSLLTTIGASNCGSGNLTVSATSSCNVPASSISWFANATGGTALATAASYAANYSATSTVYAQENFIGGETVFGNDNTGTANRGLQFSLFTDIVLNSVNIESDGNANITIQLWNATTNAPLVVNGNTYSAIVPIVTGNNVETLGWFIPAGVGYRLVVTNMGGRNLTRTPGFTFPVALPGVGLITGGVETNLTRYNIFYNWNYSTLRVPTVVTIIDPVTPAVSVTSSDIDNSICAGTSVTFTATPTNGGTPSYQWKLNGGNVGSNIATYTNAALTNGDVVTVVMTANNDCQTSATANGNNLSTVVLANVNYYVDADGDSFGPASSLISTCIQPEGYTTESGDCDDSNSEAYPFNLEFCNGIDDDCDGTSDNGLTSYTFYADSDGDGYGSNTSTISACDFVAGYLMTNGDCNDANANINPQASELCSTAFDDDCDGLINEVCNVTNDDPLFSGLIIPSTSLVNCNTVTGNLGGASPSTQVGVETLTGTAPDIWYYFTASSPGVTIRCIPTNDVKLELRSGAGLLLKSANAVTGVGDEYLNFGELTIGGQYYVRVIQQDSPALGGSFTLCTRRISSSGNLNYTNSILYDSGCDVVYASNITGSTSCSIQLTPIAPAGGPTLTATGSSIPLANFTGVNGEKFQYNTTYQATITLGFALPTGNSGTEVVNVARVSTNNLVVQQHTELDLGSVHACPTRVTIGGTIRANIWLCDAVRYQWKFEKTVNGVLQLVNGNPVVIEVFGPLGTRDFVPTAPMGFTAGSEWRVQVRPIFANNITGNYEDDYQCMKFKGTAAAMPTVEDEDELFKDLNPMDEMSLVLFPNPSGRTSVNLIWNAEQSEGVEIIVRDMQGRVVQQTQDIQGNQFVLNGADLSSGMYWVEWNAGSKSQRLRWMIQ